MEKKFYTGQYVRLFNNDRQNLTDLSKEFFFILLLRFN